MRKSSFGQFGNRLSSGPLRIKNDGGGPRKLTVGSHTPQAKHYGASTPASSRPRSALMSSGTALNQKRNSASIRSSSSGAGTSGIGMRGSGIGLRGRTDVPKDPRPISDKGFQHRCIRTVIDFLTENMYPHPISQKLLLCPPSKEFFKIFQFIYSQIDPAHKFSVKMEEDVPRLLKMLGYPFNISRSSMYAVGTPHTWPTLLAALTWLLDLVKYTRSLGRPQLDHLMFPPSDEDFDSVPDDKIKFDYICQAYKAYLGGADEYDELDDELDKVLEDKYLGQSGGIEAIRSENARMAEEIALLDQDMSRVDKLKEQQEVMLLDEKKYGDYLTELGNVTHKYEQMLQKAEEEQSSLEHELKSVLAKNQHMQAICEQQDLTLADVERLRASRQELQRLEEGLEKEVEAIDSDIWKCEMDIARLDENTDKKRAEYSRLARALRLIPSDTEQANGIDFEMRACDHDQDQKFESVIKPALMAMKNKCLEEIRQAENMKQREERLLEQMTEQTTETREEIAQLEKDIKRLDEDLECRKQLYQRDLEDLQAAIDREQQEVRDAQTSSQITVQDLERELRETHSWADQKEREIAKTEQEYAKFLCTVCTLVADHKAYIQQKLLEMEKDMKQVLVLEQERTDRMDAASKKLRETIRK